VYWFHGPEVDTLGRLAWALAMSWHGTCMNDNYPKLDCFDGEFIQHCRNDCFLELKAFEDSIFLDGTAFP